ncbi:hypothetical protein [Gordonia sp. FQ]|uniref:hypothetical protein n=1 Tax=Gordonia sp. FQ TaxID=3446634 RepID=UPI003F87483F
MSIALAPSPESAIDTAIASWRAALAGFPAWTADRPGPLPDAVKTLAGLATDDGAPEVHVRGFVRTESGFLCQCRAEMSVDGYPVRVDLLQLVDVDGDGRVIGIREYLGSQVAALS